jgi:hypothetical protein
VKTIQLIAAGTAAEGNNANVTPGLPAGTAVGDTVLILASIRNSGTGIPNTPTGWRSLTLSGGMALFARIMVRPTDFTMPTISFTGGAANATTIAQAYTIRQASGSLDTLVHAVVDQSNGSAQNIATPALTVTQDGCLVIHAAWKQSSWTSLTNPGSDLTLASFSSALGSTAAQILSGTLQTTAANVGASSYTVTGGVAAISRATTIALRPYLTTWTDAAASEPPCAFPDEFNLVSNAAAAAFQAVDDMAQFLTDLPAFRVSATSGSSVISQAVQYSTVDIDPTGMVDLVTDPSSVSTTRSGVWMNIHNVQVSPSTDGNQMLFGWGDDQSKLTSSKDNSVSNNPPSGGAVGSAPSVLTSTNANPASIWTFVSVAGVAAPANPTVLKATMHAAWVSD